LKRVEGERGNWKDGEMGGWEMGRNLHQKVPLLLIVQWWVLDNTFRNPPDMKRDKKPQLMQMGIHTIL